MSETRDLEPVECLRLLRSLKADFSCKLVEVLKLIRSEYIRFDGIAFEP